MTDRSITRPIVYTFGAFELDTRNKTLMRDGNSVACTGQRFELLALLLDNAGELVRRETIRSSLWPDRHVAYNLAINGCVRDLRQILGENSDEIFIKTVPKHGYVFVAEVTAKSPVPALPRIGFVGALAASVMVLGVAAGLWAMGAFNFSAPTPSNLHNPSDAALAAYVRAQSLYETHQPGSAERASALFRDAIGHDENYALAWAGLADSLYYGGTDLPPDIDASRQAAAHALRLDPTLARAVLRQADIAFTHDWDSTRAAALFDQALALNPGDVTIRHSYSAFLLATGQPDRASEELSAALAIDPLSAVMASDLAWTQSLSGQHEAALETCAILAELAPGDARSLACSLRPLLGLGRLTEAASIARQIMTAGDHNVPAMTPTDTLAAFWTWRLQTGENPVGLAIAYARSGDVPTTLGALERAYAQRHRLLPFVHLYPEFRALLDHPRFQAIAPFGAHARISI